MHRRRLVPLLATPLLVAATLAIASGTPAAAATFPGPAWSTGTGDIHLSSPTVADVNGDGVKDVVVGSLDRKVHVLDGRGGGELPGWPAAVPGGVESSPTVADIDGFGQPTILVGYGSLNDQGAPGGLIALKTDGTVRWNRPSMDVFNEWTGGGPDGVPEAVETTPAVGDVNNDGSKDVVWGSFDHRVYAVDKSGNNLGGFPLDLADTIWSSPALFDANHDGQLEIYIGQDSTGVHGCHWGLVRSISSTGGINWERCQDTIFQSSPSIGDIDGDGRPELVIGSGTQSNTSENKKVFAYHLDDGSNVPGWPVSLNGPVFASPAIGDVDGDGVSDVVVSTCAGGSSFCTGTPQVVALRGNGSAIWSVNPLPGANLTELLSSPVIADLNGDGRNDVAVGCEGAFCLLNGASGATMYDAIDGGRIHQDAGAIADFGNGVGWRLIVANRDPGKSGAVNSYPLPAVPGTTPPWPQYHRSAEHTSAPPPIPVAPCTQGYWLDASDGGIFTFGNATFRGGTGNIRLNQPIVGMAATPDRAGYWLVASDGGIFSFGGTAFHGSTGGMHLNQPIVGMASTPSGQGYWLVARDGGIFSFGDATFQGSTGNIRLNQPIVGMASTASGRGYWLVASDGGIFAFGDAAFAGSMGGTRLNQPIVGMASTPSGKGYWMVATDGGIFSFGDARFLGSTGNIRLNQPIVGMARTVDGNGYRLVARDGGIFAFGQSQFCGSTGAVRLNQPIVGMATAN